MSKTTLSAWDAKTRARLDVHALPMAVCSYLRRVASRVLTCSLSDVYMTAERYHLSDSPRIITAGLTGEMTHWLGERLGEVDIQPADSPEEALHELSHGDCSLLIINHTLQGPAAMDVLSRVRANPRLSDVPVLYILDRNLDSTMGRKLLEQLGVRHLMLQPVDREEVALRATRALTGNGPSSAVAAPPRPISMPLRSLPEPVKLQSTVLTPPATIESPESDEYAYLLLVGDDEGTAASVSAEAKTRGMRTEIAANPTAAREILERDRPDVILLDLAFPRATDDGLALLKNLNAQVPPIPVLVLTASDTFLDRVQVASLGGRGFLPKSLPAGEVVDAVTRLLQQLRTGESRVLAVDDDPVVLAGLRSLLEPQGIQLTTLDDPLRFWDTLEQSAPDLLMLNLDMPRLSGVELCRVVRNDARWSVLPVLFLTGESDPDTVRRVFAAGADDFVSKPVVGSELVAKIVNRLERTLLYRSLAETDPVTGVTNRRKSMHTLRQFLRLAERHNQPLSLALLDVDYFKQINDRFGHGTGDSVLQQLGKILLRTFRSEDVVARWGGEEFLIGMYGMTRLDGVQRLADVLETLRRESLPGPRGERIHITFSAGVAQFPEDGNDVQSLYRAADAAMYRAKEAGRDRVMPVGWQYDRTDRSTKSVDLVVVVDDDVIGSLLIHALEIRGYRTQWLKDGELAALMLGGLNPTLHAPVVLLDADLPDLDGYGVLRRLVRDDILRHTRVIMLTGPPKDGNVARALELGAFDHVAKPFNLPVLLQRVRRAMEVL